MGKDSRPNTTLLIIEDESALLQVLVDKFSSEKIKVLAAKDGKEGLQFALEHHPDLILLDIILPKMNGVEFLKKLRSDSWGKTAKVIVLTNLSLSSAERSVEAAEDGVYDFWVKADWKLTDVVEKVKERLNLD